MKPSTLNEMTFTGEYPTDHSLDTFVLLKFKDSERNGISA